MSRVLMWRVPTVLIIRMDWDGRTGSWQCGRNLTDHPHPRIKYGAGSEGEGAVGGGLESKSEFPRMTSARNVDYNLERNQ